MRIHIIGICGTFMGGVAALARESGHAVSGSDKNVYPPMSTQLERLGIDLIEGDDPSELDREIDCFVVGNVMTRGNPLIEELLRRRLPYMSGPDWLARHVLSGRTVVGCAGTHGKTTTSSLVAWLLSETGADPGFLIGGVPLNFGVSARLGTGPFVVEADEYDTAFFDKRAKFVHYRPDIAVLNNLEFDHADIYDDLAAIKRQFHHLVRTVPSDGRLIVNARSPALDDVLAMGAWTPIERFAIDGDAELTVRQVAGGDEIEVRCDGYERRVSAPVLAGAHNRENLAAALLAARAAGAPLARTLPAVADFEGVARRLERLVAAPEVSVYDDFAHHPTAVRGTLEALASRHRGSRLIVALELRSNTMIRGVHRERLAEALDPADVALVYAPPHAGFDVAAALAPLGERGRTFDDYDRLLSAALAHVALAGETIVMMSNGAFGGLRERLPSEVRRLVGDKPAA